MCFPSSTTGLEIRPCADNGTSAVEEGSKDFILACAGLNAAQPTVWKYRDRYPLGTQIIANCSKTTCSLPYSPLILSIINEHTQRSHMIIPDVLRGRFPDGTWTCENDGQTAQCALDVICEYTLLLSLGLERWPVGSGSYWLRAKVHVMRYRGRRK